MSSVTNKCRTRRLYLNSVDGQHPTYEELEPFGEGQASTLVDKTLDYDNQAVSAFDLGTAMLLKKPNERIGLSLIKANFNGDIGLYNSEEPKWDADNTQDYPYEFGVYLNDNPVTAALGKELRIAFTSGTAGSDVIAVSHMLLCIPATMRRSMGNFVEIINEFLAYRSDNPIKWTVSAYSKVLYVTGSDTTVGEHDCWLDNRYFNDPTFRYYKPAHAAFYRDLGVNTQTKEVWTNINLGYDKVYCDFSGGDMTATVATGNVPQYLGTYMLQRDTVNLAKTRLWLATGGTTLTDSGTANNYFLFRKDTVVEGEGARTFIMFFQQAVGWWIMKLPLKTPDFDFTGFTAQSDLFIATAHISYTDYKFPANYGSNIFSRILTENGTNRGIGQKFPVGANPSPLFVKMDRSTQSYASMADGTRDILAMCPILPENQSLAFYFDDGSAKNPPGTEQRWDIQNMTGIGMWKDAADALTRPVPIDTIQNFVSDNFNSDPDAVGYIGDTGTYTTGMFAYNLGNKSATAYTFDGANWVANPTQALAWTIFNGNAGTNWTPGMSGAYTVSGQSAAGGTWEISRTNNIMNLAPNNGIAFTLIQGVPSGVTVPNPENHVYNPQVTSVYWAINSIVGAVNMPMTGNYEIVTGGNPNFGNLNMKPLYQAATATWAVSPDDDTHLLLGVDVTSLSPHVRDFSQADHYYTSNIYVGTWKDTSQTAVAGNAPPPNRHYIKLDGADDYIEIDGLDDRVLSWNKSWSIGIHANVIDNPTEGVKRAIFKRGNNGIYFSKGAGNTGLYVTAMDGEYNPSLYPGLPHSHGVNMWYEVNSDSKLLFTYNHVTGKLMFYDDCERKATIQLTSEEMTKGVVEYPDYVGLPTPIQAACIDPLNPAQIYFFSGDYYYIYNLNTKAYVSKTLISSAFSETTTTVHNVVRNNMDFSTNLAGQLLIYETNGMMTRYTASASGFVCDDPNSGFWRGLENWKLHDAATLEHYTGQGRLVFKDDQFWESHDANGNFTGWVTYGGAGQAFAGLPHDLDGCVTDTTVTPHKVYCYKDAVQYCITYDKSTNPHTFTLDSQNAFGGSAPSPPPLKVGEAQGFTPYGGAYWDGEVSDLIIANTNLVYQSQQITDYFADDNYPSHEYWNLVTNYFPMGEDQYPAVVDDVGSASGEHKNGSAADYIVGDPLPAGHPLIARFSGGNGDGAETDLTIRNQMLQGATVAYTNKDYTGSHKYIPDTMVPSLTLTLKDEFYQTKTTNNPIEYEVEVKYVGDI